MSEVWEGRSLLRTQETKNCATAGAKFLAGSKGLNKLYDHGQIPRLPDRVSYQEWLAVTWRIEGWKLRKGAVTEVSVGRSIGRSEWKVEAGESAERKKFD